MRKTMLITFVSAAAAFVLYVYAGTDVTAAGETARYYIQNFYVDTGAQNGVAAVYLNYRVFDSVFETLMLLVSVLAVIHFTGRGGHE